MTRCKFIHFVFQVLPIRTLQNVLIKKHFEKCSNCLEELVGPEEAQGILMREDPAGQSIDIWTGIQAGLCVEKDKKETLRYFPRLKWALGATGLVLFFLVGYWAVNQSNDTRLASSPMMDDQIQINYVRVEEKPAEAYVYEPQDSEMLLVWVQRTP